MPKELLILIGSIFTLLSGYSVSGSTADIVGDEALGVPFAISEFVDGITIIDIAQPNHNGISHQHFSAFTTSSAGVIFNNGVEDSESQITGGPILANPALTTGPATLIVNEVHSDAPISLMGAIEVVGKSAEVVFLNEAGVICDGCGIINAERLILATARPFVGLDGVTRHIVEKGHIFVTGDGIVAPTLNNVSLLGRSVIIDAPIHSKELTLSAGESVTNMRFTSSLPLLPLPPTQHSEDAPNSVHYTGITAMGDVMVERLSLFSSDSLVNAFNQGKIGSTEGKVAIYASGMFVNNGLIEGGELDLKSDSNVLNGSGGKIIAHNKLEIDIGAQLINSGLIQSSADVLFSSPSRLLNTGTIDVGNILQVNMADINNVGEIYFMFGEFKVANAIDNLGVIQSVIYLDATANQLANRGVKAKINLSHAHLTLKGTLSNLDGAQFSAERIWLKSEKVINHYYALMESTAQGYWAVRDTIYNTDLAKMKFNGEYEVGEQLVGQSRVTGYVKKLSLLGAELSFSRNGHIYSQLMEKKDKGVVLKPQVIQPDLMQLLWLPFSDYPHLQPDPYTLLLEVNNNHLEVRGKSNIHIVDGH